MIMGQYWLGPKSFQIDPKHFQKVATDFVLKLLAEFSTDYLTN